MADTYPVRTEPLAVIKTPSLPTTGQIGMKDVLGIQEPYMKEKARLIPEISAAKGREAEAKQAQQVTEAEGGLAAAKGFAAAEKGAMQQYQTKLEKEPLPAFVPSKENSDDLATLFSLVSVIGMVVGGGGRENAQQAMSAMNGMLEGHQKGRADLYKQELSTFDKNFKSMVQKHAEFRKEMEDAVKLASTDKEAAMADAKLAAVKSGSNIVKAMIDQGRLLDAYKLVDESQVGVDKAVAAEAKIRSDAAKEKAAQQRHREDAAQRERLAKIRAEGSGKTSALLAGRAENIREAFAQASADIVNITKFPKGTMLGSFAGLTGASADSMVGAIRNGIARGVTDKEQRMLEALLSGIEGHMAFALGGGYATSQSKARMDQYKAQLARAGDDPAQVPLMLARFRQEMNILAENFPSKPGATPEMNKAVQKYNDAINNAVPFTVDNVLDAELGTGKKDSGKGSSVDEERSRAKAAIAAGADQAAVKARFKTKTGQEL
jgi:hypothetical protein